MRRAVLIFSFALVALASYHGTASAFGLGKLKDKAKDKVTQGVVEQGKQLFKGSPKKHLEKHYSVVVTDLDDNYQVTVPDSLTNANWSESDLTIILNPDEVKDDRQPVTFRWAPSLADAQAFTAARTTADREGVIRNYVVTVSKGQFERVKEEDAVVGVTAVTVVEILEETPEDSD